MIHFATYHGSSNPISKIISYYEEKSLQWDKNFQVDINNKLNKRDKKKGEALAFMEIPAPSHALVKLSDGTFIESDWGERILPFLPYPRKNGGVKRVTIDTLKAREGFHILWGIDAPKEKIESFERLCVDCASWRTDYDLFGLLGAGGMTFLRKDYSILQDKGKFFCSEFVSEMILNAMGVYPKLNECKKAPSDITPALLPRAFNAEPLSIF